MLVYLKGLLSLSPSCSRISAYQNTQALFGQQSSSSSTSQSGGGPVRKGGSSGGGGGGPGSSSTLDSERRRKPVPLPRSKVPSAAAVATPQHSENKAPSGHNSSHRHPSPPVIQAPPPLAAQQSGGKIVGKSGGSLHSRFFSKRSKTDLGSDNLAAYRKSRQAAGGGAGSGARGTKYPAPKVPAFTRPVPQKRSDVAAAVERRISLASAKRQQQQQQQQQQTPVTSELVVEEEVSPILGVTATSERPKPEIKEKPQFSTFKSAASEAKAVAARRSPPKVEEKRQRRRRSGSGGSGRLMSKTVSEGDLMHKLRVEGALPPSSGDLNRVVEHVSTVEPVSITVNSDTSSQGGDLEETGKVHHSREEGVNRLVIDTSKDFDGIKSTSNADLAVTEGKEGEKKLREELDNFLPPPPKPFLGKSEPLLITTQPLSDGSSSPVHHHQQSGTSVGSEVAMSEGPDQSCSTSFESTDDSLPRPRAEDDDEDDAAKMTVSATTTTMATSTTTTEDVSEAKTEPGEVINKSPNTSTMSRTPPSPSATGLRPLRKVIYV